MFKKLLSVIAVMIVSSFMFTNTSEASMINPSSIYTTKIICQPPSTKSLYGDILILKDFIRTNTADKINALSDAEIGHEFKKYTKYTTYGLAYLFTNISDAQLGKGIKAAINTVSPDKLTNEEVEIAHQRIAEYFISR